MSFIRLENVEKKFGQTSVLQGINLEIADRELVAIRGASGSGKSTLLYLLGGLDIPSSGNVIINNKNLSKLSDKSLADFRNQNVGFVFQFHFLLPSMTCLDNILLPARISGANIKLKEVEKDVRSLAQILGVEHCLTKYPYQLSGGEQQRVNIIRALSLRPKILLCDEPTGNLDSKNSEKVADLLKKLAQDFGAILLVVTHDDKVASFFPRKIVIEDGRIIG
ncbi:MAG TPA: ABC transporter ATP-binding protein [Bacteriovoracaceae bacterium]|nr:ABC transporter ATP-binding protein [Bacteriovoracaceae bacterium]